MISPKMKYESVVIRGEKIAENEWKLITEHGFEYHYYSICNKEGFRNEKDEIWKASVIEGEQILLDFIEKSDRESPARIHWNYEGRAMLEVKLKTMFRPNWNMYGTEISPFELKDSEEWPIDKNCLLPSKGWKSTKTS